MPNTEIGDIQRIFVTRLDTLNHILNVAERHLRWTGFSGQPPSLTSQAGYRPWMGLPPMSKRRTHSPFWAGTTWWQYAL